MSAQDAVGFAVDRPIGLRRLSAPWDRRRVGLVAFGLISVVLSIVSLRFIGFSLNELIDGFATSGYLGRALPPSFEGFANTLGLIGRTFMMAVAGTGLAAVLSFPLGFLAARNTAPAPWIRVAARAVIVSTRAIPDLIFAVFFVAALSIGELPGVLALGFHSIGMLGKLLADAVEETDEGGREAAFSAGASRFQAATNSVLPQILPKFVSTLLFRLDINVRSSVVLGFVGAGGIGFELRSNLRNPLRYPIGVGQAIAVMALIFLVDRVSEVARRALDGFAAVRSNDRETEVAPTHAQRTLSVPWTRERGVLMLLTAIGLVGFGWSALRVGLTPASFFRAMTRTGDIAGLFWAPDFTTLRTQMITGFKETMALALAATFLGVVAAIPFAVLVARTTTPNRFVAGFFRLLQVVVRSVPELVIVLLFVSAVGLGPLPGAVALAIGTFGFVSKLLADNLEGLATGPLEGVRSTGASNTQELASATVPQMVPSVVSTSLYAFDVNIRSSSVLGIVGAGGIGLVLDESLGMLMYESVTAVILALFAIVLVIEQLSGLVRKHLL
jgi:phosphonate transport system permease protein